MGRIHSIFFNVYPSAAWTVRSGLMLTFDDGPCPETTPAVLDILAQYHIPAVFFVTGNRAEKSKDVLKRIIADGHMVGSHGWDHKSVLFRPAAQLAEWDTRARDTIQSITGKKVAYFRPPYGKMGMPGYSFFKKRYDAIVMWSYSLQDYRKSGPDKLKSRFTRNVRNSDIVLMHDCNKNGNDSLVRALPAMLGHLNKRQLKAVLF